MKFFTKIFKLDTNANIAPRKFLIVRGSPVQSIFHELFLSISRRSAELHVQIWQHIPVHLPMFVIFLLRPKKPGFADGKPTAFPLMLKADVAKPVKGTEKLPWRCISCRLFM